jgi:hypothetical protein
LLLASGGVTHFVLMPLHFITTRRSKLLRLWPNKASEHGICHHARRQLMPPLKVPGVSCCLITSLLRNLYTII